MILSTINRYLTLGALVIILASVGWAFVERYKTNKTLVLLEKEKAAVVVQKTRAEKLDIALKASESQRKIAEDAVAQRDTELAALEKKKEASDAKLRQVLRSNPSWSSTAIPDGVRDAITGRSGSANTNPSSVDPD